jgi:hypothetical protein
LLIACKFTKARRFHKWGIPKNGWFRRGNPTKMDDLGVSMAIRILGNYHTFTNGLIMFHILMYNGDIIINKMVTIMVMSWL